MPWIFVDYLSDGKETAGIKFSRGRNETRK
jgi:hypothetical protein